MQVVQAVVRIGTDAMNELSSHYKNETAIRETVLSKHIADRLPKNRGWKSWAERYYTRIAVQDCGIAGTKDDLVPQFGGWRADIFLRRRAGVLSTVFGGRDHLAIVEIKIVDEGRPLAGVLADYQRIQRFRAYLRANQSDTNVDGYVAAVVCDLTNGVTAEQTINALQRGLPQRLEINSGKRVPARGGGWGWRFICCKMPLVR
jgi:hypothetical protein